MREIIPTPLGHVDRSDQEFKNRFLEKKIRSSLVIDAPSVTCMGRMVDTFLATRESGLNQSFHAASLSKQI